MDLQQLQAMGAFTPQKIHKREVKVKRPTMLPAEDWDDPEIPEFTGETVNETITVHIRNGSSADDIELSRASERDQPFIAVYRFVCNEKGQPVFESVEQAMTLKSWLLLPIFNAIAEVRSQSPKASRRRTNSGSKSPSPSAVAARKNGNSQLTESGVAS